MNPFLNDTDGVLPSNASETALTDYDGMSTLPICLYLTVTAVATVQAWVNCTNASDDNGICVSRQCYILNFVFFLSLLLSCCPALKPVLRHPASSSWCIGGTQSVWRSSLHSHEPPTELSGKSPAGATSQRTLPVSGSLDVKLRELRCDLFPKL